MMKCENLKAYLDGELGRFDRLMMRAHLKLCAACRENAAEWARLSREVERLEGEPVPAGLKERLMTAAAESAASARAWHASSPAEISRAKGVWTMRRVIVAAGIAVLLMVCGVWLLPRPQDNVARADVLDEMARAMSKIRSVHITGWRLDDATGERRAMEGWVKGPDKIRITVKGIEDVADDGKQLVAVEYGKLPQVSVRPTGTLPGLYDGMTYLDLFSGPSALRSAMTVNRARMVTERPVRLADGRKGTATELQRAGGDKMVILTDSATDLVAGWKAFRSDGTCGEVIEKIEYDVPIPDSVFKISIPKSLPVLKMAGSPRPTTEKGKTDAKPVKVASSTAKRPALDREAEKKRLSADPNARCIANFRRGSCGSPFHSGFRFEAIGEDGIAIFYLPDRNVYRCIGKVRVYSAGYSEIVEDANIRLPGEPEIEEVLMLNGKPGAYCGIWKDDPEAGVYRLQNIGPGPCTITLNKLKQAFIIRGRAKLLPTGEIYANTVAPKPSIWEKQVVAALDEKGKEPDFGGLPPSEVELMKANLDYCRRYVALDKAKFMVNGEKAKLMCKANKGTWGRELQLNILGPAYASIYRLEPSGEFYIIGRVRVQKTGKICKNGFISKDGEIISSEE